MCLWLTPDTLATLRAEAERTKVPASELAESYIRAGLQQEAVRVLEDTALPQLEATLQKVVQEQACHTEERLAKLLVRLLLETGVARRLAWSLLARTYGRDDAVRVNEAAFTASAQAVRQRGWVEAVAGGLGQEAAEEEEI
jgi:hypothetical protein